jgi:hypothetical protein
LKNSSQIKILGHVVTVKTVKRPFVLQDQSGEADPGRGVISVLEGLEASVREATILHEVIHILDHHLALQMNEEQVTGIAQGLFSVLKDNPEFLR